MRDWTDRDWRGAVVGIAIWGLAGFLVVALVVGLAVLFDIIAEVVR